MTKADRLAHKKDMHAESLHEKAIEAGYSGCFEQALCGINEQMPGSLDPEKTARKVVEAAEDQLESISRVIGMRLYSASEVKSKDRGMER